MAGILLNRNRQVPAEETPAFGGIAERFRRGGDLDRAIALCRDGLKRFPDQLSARVTLGWALLDKGQYDAARGELEHVLRKAPDNLAAIRGLAELHDRTEGALPADESSWKSDDALAADATMSPSADVSAAMTPVAGHDPLAPIPVHFDNSAAEVVHTAAQAEQDAAEATSSTYDAAAELAAAPVELEDPAAASMAAADPAPFFVVDPVDATAFDAASAVDVVVPVPFEVGAVDAVNVEIETAGAAALAAVEDGAANAAEFDSLAFSLETFASQTSSPSAFTTGGDDVATPDNTQDAEADWSALATLSGSAAGAEGASWDEASSPAAFDGLADAPDGIASDALDLDVLSTSALDENGEVVAAVFTAPQSLDDIDEIAGQELADAIKALEEAAKRVEARLSTPLQQHEPAASPEDIAAFDFGATVFGASAQIDEQQTGFDSGLDGGFELAPPDLSDLPFTTDVSAELSSDDIEPLVADAAAPQFDFETASEIADAPSADTPDAADSIALVTEVDTTDLLDAVAADESADDPSAGESDTPTGGSPASFAALLEGLDIDAADEVGIVDASISDIESEDIQAVADNEIVADSGTWRVDAAHGADNVIAWPDAPAASPDVDATIEVEALEAPVRVEVEDVPGEPAQAERVEDTPDAAAETPAAAMVATDLDDAVVLHTERLDDANADIAAVAADASSVIDTPSPDMPEAGAPPPVVHVYDVPVFAAAHAAAIAELADLTDQVAAAPAVTMGYAETTGKASTLAALERFLRKVQARRLELHGETVA